MVQMESPVHQWLKTQGYWKNDRSSPASVTHLFLDGGVACVPEEMIGTFNNIYAASALRQDNLFVVEKKPPAFRMFFDFDMRTDSVMDDDAILQLSTAVSDLVCDFFGLDTKETRCLVCLSEPTCDPNKKWWKTGVHLIWPDTATVGPDALRCRDHVLQRLDDFRTWFRTPLETVIDRSVLDKNGMRMIGSHKLVPCGGSACTSACTRCNGRRKVIQRGVYWPRYTIRGGESHSPIKPIETLQDMRYWVSQTSLRICPSQLCRHQVPNERDEEGILKCSYGNLRLFRQSLEPQLTTMLERFKDTLPPPFWTMRFTNMYRGGDDDDDPVFLARTTARYCLNVGRTHQSNNVYFLFSERGAYQMCFCRCPTTEGRKSGLCENFHSKMFPIPTELKIALFGVTKKEDSTKPVSNSGTRVLDKQYDALMRYCGGIEPKKKSKKK